MIETHARSDSLLTKISRWDWFSLILPAIAISPLLFLQSLFLLEKEHLQFYPLAFAAAGYFFFREGENEPSHGPRGTLALVTSCGACLAAGYALFLSSPWMAQFALVCLIWAWAVGKFSNLSLLRISGICGLLAVTVPAPMGWDHKLVQSLQSLSSTICSQLMDATSILHVKRGNIIEIASKPLFVEEACSGVDSQYALMAVAGVLLLVGRAGLVVSLITIVTVPIWAILGNLLRIYTIVIGLELFNVDLSSGTEHTVLGLVVFAVAAWAHWSSVQFLNYCELMWMTRSTDGIIDDIPITAQESERVIETRPVVNPMRSYPNNVWFALPGVLLLLCPTAVLTTVMHFYKSVPKMSTALVEQFPGESVLPTSLNGQRKMGFQTTSRDRRDILGQYSRIWIYTGVLGMQTCSLDMPFRGWHPLWECYINAGWKRSVSNEITTDTQGNPLEFPYFESLMENAEGEFAVMHFCLFDENGQPYDYEGSYEHSGQGNRFGASILRWLEPGETDREPITFQYQMLSKTTEPATPEQIAIFREMFLRTRQEIYQKSMPIIEKLRGR